jgi:hypothetical protein
MEEEPDVAQTLVFTHGLEVELGRSEALLQ